MGLFKRKFGVRDVFDPVNPLIFGDDPSKDYAKQAAKAEAERQERIRSGLVDVNATFAGFTPTFYDDRARAYEKYALPQLATQYQGTRNQLLQGLASRGLLKSSAGTKQLSAFESRAQGAKQTIAETGRSQASALQKAIEDQRNAIIGQLYQSADPANARQAATSTAAGFRQPSVFGPIANMFSDLINTYYTNQMLEATKRSATPTYADYDYNSVNPSAVGGGVSSRRI